MQGDQQQETPPAPQSSSRKAPADGNGKRPPKVSSKNVRRVEEQVVENPEFLDDLAISDDNANDDVTDGPPMGTGITSRFNICHEHLH